MLWALAGLSVVGIALSVATSRRMARVGRCASDADCDDVMKTSYARLLGFPNSHLSAAYFAGILAFAALRLARVSAPIEPALAAAGASVAVTAYLAWALLVKLKKT